MYVYIGREEPKSVVMDNLRKVATEPKLCEQLLNLTKTKLFLRGRPILSKPHKRPLAKVGSLRFALLRAQCKRSLDSTTVNCSLQEKLLLITNSYAVYFKRMLKYAYH